MNTRYLTPLALCVSAFALGLAHLFIGTTAQAGPVGSVSSNRDFTMVTARSAAGNDTIYVNDNRRGMVAVFQYDVTTRSIKPVTVRSMSDILNPGQANGR